MDFAITTKFFIAMFAIMNPLTTMPVYLALTSDEDAAARRSTVWVILLTVGIGALITALVGKWLLAAFGIDIAHFTLAGGLIVLIIALSMLSGDDHSSQHGTASEKATYNSASSGSGVYPLGIPLSLGPGAMATILIFEQSSAASGHYISYYLGLAAYLVFFGVVMLFAPRIGRLLSPGALSVVKRVMGIILAAIAMEMIGNALGKIFPAWLA